MKKIAIVHDWFTTFAGSEQVVKQMLHTFPQADIFSLIDFLPARDRQWLGNATIQTSFLQNMPFVEKHYRQYLALMPLAIEQFDLSGYDLVLSSSHAVAKGVITGPRQLHISYIYTPIRYAWDMQNQYLSTSGFNNIKSILARLILHYIRLWDLSTAGRPDVLIGSSHFITSRIEKIYRRTAQVIYPPVDTDYFTLGHPNGPREDFYLTASRLVPYKRVDLIVQAFQAMPEKKLVILGDGSEAPRIKQLGGPNITWLGYQPNEVLKSYMQRCKAFVYAAQEDFGIFPLEAQACGAPVIAYGVGGVRETVHPPGRENVEATGIHYPEQTPAAIRAAILEFERDPERFSPAACRRNAEKFSNQRFRAEFGSFVLSAWDNFKSKETT